MARAAGWTDAERRQIGDWLLSGKSLGRIAKLIGVNRNVVIGRVSRDGELHSFVGQVVVARKLGMQTETVRRRSKRREPAQVPIVPGPIPAHEHRALLTCTEVGTRNEPVQPMMPGELPGRPLTELGPLECKWAVAEHPMIRGRHLFCGKPRRPDQPYCLAHLRRAH
jgi:hypothetical protein